MPLQAPDDYEVEMVPLEDLKGASWNPRSISAKAMEKLKASIRDFGLPQPVIVNRRSEQIVGGHQRVEAVRQLGWEKVPVTYVDLSDDEERALNIALNNAELAGEWDMEKLAQVIADIADQEMRKATGFDQRKIDQLLEDLLKDEEEEIAPIYPLTPRFLESYDYVVIFTTHETDWANLQTMLGLQQEQSYKNSKVGLGRVVPFEVFRERFEESRQVAYGSQSDRPHAFQRALERDGRWLCGLCGLEKNAEVHEVPEETAVPGDTG